MKAYIAALVLLFTLLAVPLSAQDWSAEQKEVWSNVEAYWKLLSEGNTAGLMEYFHEDFSGWSYNAVVPQSKAARAKFVHFFVPKNKWIFYSITPVSIKVHGDFAFVHYLYTELTAGPEGKPKWEAGRWTDILTKQGNRWVLLGDHGGATDDGDEDDD